MLSALLFSCLDFYTANFRSPLLLSGLGCPSAVEIHDRRRSMDPSSVPATSPIPEEEDQWDTEGFVIPSFGIEQSNNKEPAITEEETSELPQQSKTEGNGIYLGPHGAPPQSRQQDLNSSSRKQRLKQKLKEADRKSLGTGRENKVVSLQELVGAGKVSREMDKGSPREWLDSHCHESDFEKKPYNQ